LLWSQGGILGILRERDRLNSYDRVLSSTRQDLFMQTTSASRRTGHFESRVETVAEDLLCIRIPHNATTLDGFRSWIKSDEFPDKLRAMYLDGEIYLDMTKEELQSHAKVKAEISRVLMNLVRELALGEFYLDGVLVTHPVAKVSNNPDATFLSWASLERQHVRLVPGHGEHGQFVEIEGTPDWILEVVSNSSVHKDTERLRTAYHRAGIAEYWLVDARGTQIVFHILHWRKTGYVAATNRKGWQRSRVFARDFRLVRKAVRLGLWEYTLEMRAES
jgi:Uma2 family endonuclease